MGEVLDLGGGWVGGSGDLHMYVTRGICLLACFLCTWRGVTGLYVYVYVCIVAGLKAEMLYLEGAWGEFTCRGCRKYISPYIHPPLS